MEGKGARKQPRSRVGLGGEHRATRMTRGNKNPGGERWGRTASSVMWRGMRGGGETGGTHQLGAGLGTAVKAHKAFGRGRCKRVAERDHLFH